MELLAQLLVNGIINGAHYALLGMSWGLIFGPTRIVHFAHGPIYAIGAYTAWAALSLLGLPLLVAAPLGIACAAAAGVLSYRLLYRPFVRRGSSPLVILIASLGLFIVLENVIGIVAGSDTKAADGISTGVFLLGPVVFTELQLAQVVALVLAGGLLAWFLTATSHGQAILAMNDNAEMARIIGINTDRVTDLVFAIGSALAAVAAILILLKEGATPHMGFNAVFMAFVAVIVGGIGSLRGAALGGMLLGIVENVGMWQIPTEWQSTIAFAVLFIVLLVRPTGLMGTR